MTVRETAEQIEQAAAHWVWRLDREGEAPELMAELAAWRSGDPRREGALLQAECAWMMLDRASILGHGALAPTKPASPWRRWRFSAAVAAGAGALIAACLVASVMVLPGERYGTAVGEIRRVPLKDGSTAAINTQSNITVDLEAKQRRVKVERGEAWFQVAKNPERPFVVEAGKVRVRAVGTAFSVRKREGGADVVVTEGVVEAWVDGAEGYRVRISAGARAHVSDNAAVARSIGGPSEVDRQLAWRSGKIDLAGETLAEAAAEFNRYNVRQIVVPDPVLAQKRLYGVFRTDDPEGFAKAAVHGLNAKHSINDEGNIQISTTGG